MEQTELLVVKVGTTSLTKDGLLDQSRFDDLANQILDLPSGLGVVVVTSAAISAGAAELGVDRRDFEGDVDGLSMLASVGQPLIMGRWRQAFHTKKFVGQHEVTPRELKEDPQERDPYFRKLAYALGRGIVPIVNENDAISDEEIKIGDNDQLAALVTVGLGRLGLWKEVSLLNLSDIDGLFDGDPGQEGSKLINRVDDVHAARAWVSDSASGHGTGGAITKLDAAEMVTRAGLTMRLANSRAASVIQRALHNEIGTYFPASKVE